MGAWDTGPFENDDAMDWVGELTGSDDMAVIESAFDTVIDRDEELIEAPDCCNALAAAEVVAALHGKPCDSLPKEIVGWVIGKAKPGDALVRKARDAVAEVGTDQSELLELWKEAEPADLQKWLESIDDLKKRLA